MADLKQLLSDALAELDNSPQLDLYQAATRLDSIIDTADQQSEPYPNELRFERLAFGLHRFEEPTQWNIYYGLFNFNEPPITAEHLVYWTSRMKAARQPVLRARYADLVWDTSLKVCGKREPIDAAQIAIDSYLEAVVNGRNDPNIDVGDTMRIALGLAASIGDEARLSNLVAKLVEHASADTNVNEAESRQRELLRSLLELPKNKRPATEMQQVASMIRSRFDDLVSKNADQWTLENLALLLAEYYKSQKQSDDLKDVLRKYGAEIVRSTEDADALLAAGWLDRLHKLYKSHQMEDEAASVMAKLEAVQPKTVDSLVKRTQTHAVSEEDMETVLREVVGATLEHSIHNCAVMFIPRVEEERKELQAFQESHQLLSKIPTAIVGSDGRVVATLPHGLADDGQLICHINQRIQIDDLFLKCVFDRMNETHDLTAYKLLAEITKSPVWQKDRLPILKRGIEAFLANDPIVAIHILVPEIESAVRTIAKNLGISLQKPNEIGGFDLKSLGNLLFNEKMKSFLTEDVTVYLRTALIDQRGWKLRNYTCHGVYSADSFTAAASRRIMHIVFTLSIVRRNERESGSSTPTAG